TEIRDQALERWFSSSCGEGPSRARTAVWGDPAGGAIHLAAGRATVRQAPGAHLAAVAAVLRTPFRALEPRAPQADGPNQRRDLGSVAGTGAGRTGKSRPGRY